LLVSAFSVVWRQERSNSDLVLHSWSLELTAFLSSHVTQSSVFKALNSYLKYFIFFSIFCDIFKKLFLLSYKVAISVVHLSKTSCMADEFSKDSEYEITQSFVYLERLHYTRVDANKRSLTALKRT
jgi:hypothetical protein